MVSDLAAGYTSKPSGRRITEGFPTHRTTA